MSIFKKIAISLLIVAVALTGFGATVQPAAAQSSCARYHTVWWGQTLYQIGLMYGVSWIAIGQANNIPNPSQIYAGQVLCIPSGTAYGTGGSSPCWPWCYGTGGPVTPSFTVINVSPNISVTIQTANFPANENFDVFMNTFGTQGVGGTKVATVNSGSGGQLVWSFTIPPQLANQPQIDLRLQSQTTGTYAYSWFYNSTYGTGGPVVPPGTTGGPVYFGVPTIAVAAVKTNTSVTVTTYNFPPNDTYNAYMGYFGTSGIGGIYVGSVNSGAGGTQSYTFTIPPQLAGQPQIAIRLESPTSGYFAFNWFYNNSTY